MMIKFVEKILTLFETCFSRHSAFRWFVVIIAGLMIRSDKLGVTSIIRDLCLNPKHYETMLHFFRASSWELADIQQRWCEAVRDNMPLCQEEGYTILVGDGVKQAKEGKRMPGVKKLFQESENSSKPEYIHGHMLGAIGVLTGTALKRFCTPLHINIQDGVQAIRSQEDAMEEPHPSHVVQMIANGYEAAKTFGKSLLLLDRYFLSVPALERLKQCNSEGDVTMHMVTKAKCNCVAYERPAEPTEKRGRPAKKGVRVKLSERFTDTTADFIDATVILYGKVENIRYHCVDLLWGTKLYQELRFVLVEYRNIKSILVSTDLTLDPVTIVRLYSYRFSIECAFRELKQVVGAFHYRFWCKSLPRLNRYAKKGDPSPIETVSDPKEKENIRLTVKATEGYVMFSSIAMGLLQMISLKYSAKILKSGMRFFLRTPSKEILSEASVARYLRKNIFRILPRNPESTLTRFIHEKQDEPDYSDEWQAS